MNKLTVEAYGKWSFLQRCYLQEAMGRLFQVPSTYVPPLLSSTEDSGLGSPGLETMSSTVTVEIKDERTILGILEMG